MFLRKNIRNAFAWNKSEFMRKAFHTEGKLIYIGDGKYTTRTFEEYIFGMSGEPAADKQSVSNRLKALTSRAVRRRQR
jgi:hypothetical protein